MMAWTRKKEDLVAKLWTAGWTAREISEHIGDVSRNAIIGKVNRLGLATQRPGQRRNGKAPPERKPTVRMRPAVPKSKPASKNNSYRRVTKEPTKPVIVACKKEDSEMKKSSADESVHMTTSAKGVVAALNQISPPGYRCKWPFGDPQEANFHFCGRQREKTDAYCTHHKKLAYQAHNTRKRPW